jgi:hypothetical protein
MAENALGITEIENQEHISPQKTGDNIAAKRVAPYVWDPMSSDWQRSPAPYVPYSYDYVAITYNTTTDVYKFYQGGSGGTLVATVTLAYSNSTKSQLNSVTRT